MSDTIEAAIYVQCSTCGKPIRAYLDDLDSEFFSCEDCEEQE